MQFLRKGRSTTGIKRDDEVFFNYLNETLRERGRNGEGVTSSCLGGKLGRNKGEKKEARWAD